MRETSRWHPVEAAPEGVEVLTKIDDDAGVRHVQPLLRRGRLWLYPDGSVYVYYTPTHWSWLDAPKGARTFPSEAEGR